MRKAAILGLCATLLGGCVVHEYTTTTPGVSPVTKGEVVAMTEAGYADSAILERIRQNGVERKPAADDIVEMKRAGVSSAVMDAMLTAPLTQYRPAREDRTVVVEDYSEPAWLVGMGLLTGYFVGRSHRSHSHVHYAGCGCRH